jgi:hypothetical protein
MSPDILGMMAGYARRVDPAAAGSAMVAAGGSQPLAAAFAAKVTWAKPIIEQRVAALDPRRKDIWVGVPEQVWTERHEYFERYAKLYAELDPQLAIAKSGQGDLAGAVGKLRALRGKYLDACKVEGCLFTPFVLESTRALALLAVRLKDVPSALAEADLLHDDRLESQYFSRAMLAALLPATEREAAQWEKYSHAKGGGADEASLSAMFGPTPPIQISPDGPAIVWGRRTLADVTAALPTDGFAGAAGNGRSVERHGALATVRFADEVTEYTDSDCHETGKIDGISSDGKLIYRQACTNFRTRVEHRKVAPIQVPAEEAAALRPGDLAGAWVTADTRKGVIVNAQQQDKLVQVRGHRLRVKESRRERR